MKKNTIFTMEIAVKSYIYTHTYSQLRSALLSLYNIGLFNVSVAIFMLLVALFFFVNKKKTMEFKQNTKKRKNVQDSIIKKTINITDKGRKILYLQWKLL